MTYSEPVIVRVTHSFSAQPERIFDAWLDPAMLSRWMFGPLVRDEQVVRLCVDARVGGGFSFVVKRQTIEIDHVGTYRELDRPGRLVFTWGIAGASVEESLVRIDIVAHSGGCELTLTHEMDSKWAEYAGRTQAGWTMMVTKLASMLDAA